MMMPPRRRARSPKLQYFIELFREERDAVSNISGAASIVAIHVCLSRPMANKVVFSGIQLYWLKLVVKLVFLAGCFRLCDEELNALL